MLQYNISPILLLMLSTDNSILSAIGDSSIDASYWR